MKFKYKRRVVNQTDESTPDERTHILYFVEAIVPQPGAVASTVQLYLPEAEAAAYTIGGEYDLALTPAGA